MNIMVVFRARRNAKVTVFFLMVKFWNLNNGSTGDPILYDFAHCLWLILSNFNIHMYVVNM